ncbi:MAG: hypothetical protein ABI151_17895, partial [Chitinophagaceae bacterium]
YSKAGSRPLIDVALFAMKNDTAQQIVYSPGQPNIVKGPNGFEWWLVYMADQTDERRSQYADRVHFFDKTMYVDGITGKNVSGFHPLPSLPSVGDIFDGKTIDADRYRFLSGKLAVADGEAHQAGDAPLEVLIKDAPATNYLFEAGIKPGSVLAGVFMWYQDAQNNMKVIFNRDRKQLQVVTKQNSIPGIRNIPLPADFKYDVFHNITIRKNHSQFQLEIDGLKLAGAFEFFTSFSGKGVPGFYSSPGTTAFDGMIYTKGFDEYDTGFAGWQVASSGKASSGQTAASWITDSAGSRPLIKNGNNKIVKGDLLQNYEFGVQVSSRDTVGAAGTYPVYIDEKNWVKSALNFAKGTLVITSMNNGIPGKSLELSLHQTSPKYADIKYSDFAENIYPLPSLTQIDGLRLSRCPVYNPDTLLTDMYKKMEIMYRSAGTWKPLASLHKEESDHPGFDHLVFDPIFADALRFTNKGADGSRFIYKIWVEEKVRLSYNLRTRKTGNQIVFFIDGKNVASLEHSFGPSKVGLFTENNDSGFNGAILYDLPGNSSNFIQVENLTSIP